MKMLGRKVTMVPTPPMTPSMIRDWTMGATPTASIPRWASRDNASMVCSK